MATTQITAVVFAPRVEVPDDVTHTLLPIDTGLLMLFTGCDVVISADCGIVTVTVLKRL